jgi:hypothetical protein
VIENHAIRWYHSDKGIFTYKPDEKSDKSYDKIQYWIHSVAVQEEKTVLQCFGLSLIREYKQSFEIKAVTLKMSNNNPDTDYLKTFCDRIMSN